MIDSKAQRINMVESQVRPSDVTDRRIIRAMLEVPREAFVPPALNALAYMDEAVPVARRVEGRVTRALLAPRTLAKLVQLAEIEAGDKVLDVGCATGYSTAVLARLAGEVVALESDDALAARAAEALRQLHVKNAQVERGALEAGVPGRAPFDAILLNGAVQQLPQALLEQLADGGRLVAVLADGAFGSAQVWRRSGHTFDARPAFDAGAAPLPGFARTQGFTL
jgi:protein-L-isoaspartate(D-aspartate) O-methyltransferase